MDSWRLCGTALPHQLLSGDAVNDAHRKTDDESLEEEGMTNAWNKKARIPNMVNKISKTKLINEVHNKQRKTAAAQDCGRRREP
jgi:hypothetical protein